MPTLNSVGQSGTFFLAADADSVFRQVNFLLIQVDVQFNNASLKSIPFPVLPRNQDSSAGITKIIDLKRLEEKWIIRGILHSDDDASARDKLEALISRESVDGDFTVNDPNEVLNPIQQGSRFGMFWRKMPMTFLWRVNEAAAEFTEVRNLFFMDFRTTDSNRRTSSRKSRKSGESVGTLGDRNEPEFLEFTATFMKGISAIG